MITHYLFLVAATEGPILIKGDTNMIWDIKVEH
jgi:hypothetical protein